MGELPDGMYEAMVVDVDVDDDDDIARVDLVITTGDHKGFVVPLRGRVGHDVIGLPATITVAGDQIAVRFS